VDFEIDLRSRRVRWTGAKVLEATCEADLCTVESKVDYKVNQPVPGVPEWKSSEQIAERWVRVDGRGGFSRNDQILCSAFPAHGSGSRWESGSADRSAGELRSGRARTQA
jgi:hypothetical protein